MDYVGSLDQIFTKKVIANWSLPVNFWHSLDAWKMKIRRLKKMLKGWNINVEGQYKNLKRDYMDKIEVLDKKVSCMGSQKLIDC